METHRCLKLVFVLFIIFYIRIYLNAASTLLSLFAAAQPESARTRAHEHAATITETVERARAVVRPAFQKRYCASAGLLGSTAHAR